VRHPKINVIRLENRELLQMVWRIKKGAGASGSSIARIYSPQFFASCQGEAHLEKQPIAKENEQPNLTKNLMSVIEPIARQPENPHSSKNSLPSEVEPIDLEKEKNKHEEKKEQ
jgi:hypothetical protein